MHLRRIADSVATLYDRTLDEFMPFMDFVKAEALVCGLGWNPKLDTWLATAGQGHDEVTRDPDALNKS